VTAHLNDEARRAIRAAGLVVLLSWGALLITAGNSGLQRLVSGDLSRLLEQPGVLAAAALASLVAGFVAGGPVAGARIVAPLVVSVLVLDLAAALAAVALVGELHLSRIWLATAVLAGAGTQPLASALGLVARERLSRPS